MIPTSRDCRKTALGSPELPTKLGGPHRRLIVIHLHEHHLESRSPAYVQDSKGPERKAQLRVVGETWLLRRIS